jgi:hypothetical protein
LIWVDNLLAAAMQNVVWFLFLDFLRHLRGSTTVHDPMCSHTCQRFSYREIWLNVSLKYIKP